MSEIYEDFFKKAKEIQEKIELKKLRGLNDFNIFTTLLKVHDEVKLHSNFLYAMLNTNGNHYQGKLFLDLFVKQCEIKNFNTSIAKIYKEYQGTEGRIDLYITDGENHIIIENKIYANEQEDQIKRYIESIVDENSENKISGNNIYVLYLSKNIDEPSEYSLENFKLYNENNKTFLKYDGNGKLFDLGKISFKSIHYNKEIKDWLDACLREVSNLTNLQVIITQYKNTIELLYGTYKGVEMELEEFIKENYETSKEIYDKFEDARNQMIGIFLKKIVKSLNTEQDSNKYDLLQNWTIDFEDNCIEIYKSEWDKIGKYLYFEFAFDKNMSEDPYFGIKIHNLSLTSKLKKIREKNEIKWENSKYQTDDDDYLCYFWLSETMGIKDDFVLNIINKSDKEKIKLANNMIEKFIDFINEFKEDIEKINENIEDYLE